jgi:CheY-like chemotaxis protein
LIVDDDPEVREIFAETLEVYGYTVSAAASGQEALDILGGSPDIQMMISDVRMPGMSGLELVERAVAAHPDLKVILISGYFLPQQVARRFLKKPFHIRDLVAAVAEELGVAPQPR